jgi:hypothetical protein
MSGFANMESELEVRHVYPLEDIREHDIENVNCQCSPLLEVHDGVVIVIHRTWDKSGSAEFFRGVHGEVIL